MRLLIRLQIWVNEHAQLEEQIREINQSRSSLTEEADKLEKRNKESEA